MIGTRPTVVCVLLASLCGVASAQEAQDRDLFKRAWSAVSLPHERVVLSSKLVERVDAVLVKEGDTVKHDELLIQLDASVLEKQIDVAEAGADYTARIASAVARHEHLAREYDRLHMVGPGVSQSDLDKALTQRDLAALDSAELKRQETAARLQVQYYRARLSDYRITSPIDGMAVVSNIWVKPGEMVDEAQRLIELINPTLIEVHVHVPERNLPLLTDVRRVEVSFPAVGDDASLPAEMYFISPYVDSASGTCMVKLLVKTQPNSVIKPGLGCTVRFYDTPAEPDAEAPAPEAK